VEPFNELYRRTLCLKISSFG